MIRSKVDMERAQKANHVLRNLFVVLLLMTIAAICFFYVFLIRNVTFTGNERFDQDELIRMSGLVYQESMFLVDKQQVTEALEQNPYIIVEQVCLIWPCTVNIVVQERSACALTQHLDNTLLLDSTGVVLSTDAAVLQEQMCDVTGWEILSSHVGEVLQTEQSLQLAAYACVAGELEKFSMMEQVRSIDVSDVLAISLTMRDGMQVKLGDTTSMTTKITWLSQMCKELGNEGYRGGTLDLTSGNSASYLPETEE